MIPFDLDIPAVRTALVRARLQNGGGRQPPPSNPPVTYANNGDNECTSLTNIALAAASAGCKPDVAICTGNFGRAMRPDYANDIDRIVDQLIADGDVKLDPATDAYVGTRGAHWRWRYERQQSP